MSAADVPQLRLGLALSGGGFRASFFHLGALRRLAELGLLRHVSDISTVSGGSILAVHYYLRFREKFEDTGGKLDDSDYVEVVREVEEEFIKGNRADLRNRLLYEPLTHLRALILGRGYGNRMAQLYTRFFYRNVIETIDRRSGLAGAQNWLKEGIPIHQSIVTKPDQPSGDRLQNKSSSYPNSEEPEAMLAEFNRKPEYATIPRLVINATCLNEGGPFHFMLNEVGGPETGYVRFDEVFMLLQYKMLITSIRGRRIELGFLRRVMQQALMHGAKMERLFPELPSTAFKLPENERDPMRAFPTYTVEHLSMYLAGKGYLSEDGADGHSWLTGAQPTSEPTRWLASSDGWPSMRHLMECDYGSLRRAKLAAWYLLDEKGWGNGSRGGRTRDDYRNAFWSALAAIDEPISEKFGDISGEDFERLMTFVVDLYYLRSAEALDWEAPTALRKLTLSHAVAASANFPPVFTPFKIFNLYDGETYESLALTDGGVHDNQGVETLLEAGCTHIIVSDAGGIVRPEYRPADGRIPMMDRVIDLLMGGVRRAILRTLQRTVDLSVLAAELAGATDENRELQRVRENTPLQRAAIFHMSANVSTGMSNGLPPFAPMEVAQIRTDLDRFNPLEIAALRHQGYQLADRYVRCFADEKIFGEPTHPIAELQSPAPELPLHPTRKQRKVLRGGALLFGRFSAAYPAYSATLAFVIALALLIFCHDRVLTVAQIHSFYQQGDLTRYLPAGTVPPIKEISQVSSAFVLDHAGKVSVLALPFLLWAIVIALQEAIRAYRQRTKDEITSVDREVWKDRVRWTFALFKRPWNLLTIASLIAFALTLQAKWLMFFVPLWSLLIAAVFFLVHWVFTPLWWITGHVRETGVPKPQ